MDRRELARQNLDPAPVGSADRGAMALLPAEWVRPVGFFLACKAHLVKSRLAVCASLKLWIEAGLELDDAKLIFRKLALPDRAARHVFESELVADLAAEVAAAIRRRKQVAEQACRRAMFEAGEGGKADGAGRRAADAEVFRLADSFGMPDAGGGE